VPVFVITHKDFVNELINAKARGVDVKIIVDATSASSKYSMIKTLRDNGIKVKTENRAGKMHMKSIIIDDLYSIIGSMNFTKSGEYYNDENLIIIKNQKLTQKFKKIFLELYNNIPDIWLSKNPPAESKYSINSCNDGVDNDFDQKIDSNDSSCHITIKQYN
jgi:phosphatidylserine/phosphatidylglycerophosphate/cardiolipin synthase-like enzyme